MITNKKELASKVADKMEGTLTKKAAADAVNAVFEAIAEDLAAGNSVNIYSFGTFESRKRAARTARSPLTGEAVEVPEKLVPAFRASKLLKNRVAGKTE